MKQFEAQAADIMEKYRRLLNSSAYNANERLKLLTDMQNELKILKVTFELLHPQGDVASQPFTGSKTVIG